MNNQIPSKLQELNPKAAHLCLGIENFITSELSVPLKDTTILLALSGGVDSTALLIILSCLAKKNDFTLQAAHFNHQLRPEAPLEENHVRNLCESLNVNLTISSQNVAQYASQQKIGIEEAARLLRYSFLKTVKNDIDADWIVTGHHANDLAEDIVMRLTRGTGWPALGGMEGKCNSRKLLRPLLATPKEALITFAKACSLTWCEDTSNKDQNFLRNRVRSQVIPLLCKENPAFLDAITSLWELAQIDTDHWTATIEQHLENTDLTTPKLLKEDLKAMSKATRLRVYKAILDSMGNGQPLQHNLLALDAAWQANVGGKTVQFPGNKIATIRKGAIYFSYR